jgi:hypothetical protein
MEFNKASRTYMRRCSRVKARAKLAQDGGVFYCPKSGQTTGGFIQCQSGQLKQKTW